MSAWHEDSVGCGAAVDRGWWLHGPGVVEVVGAIESADAGSIRVDNTDITTLSRQKLTAYRRSIGLVFQRYHLLPALTALENVLAPVLPYQVGFDKTARARELLALVGLADRERTLPSRLSGGQQQRVAIARALMGSPRLLLADEPTGNLDSHTGGEILQLLLRLRDEPGMTVVMPRTSSISPPPVTG